MIPPADIQQLLAHPDLLAAAESCTSFDDPVAVGRLRKIAEIELVHAAIDLVLARRKAAAGGKLPQADRLMLDPAGVEQASSHAVAMHKAERFAQAGVAHVVDLCCGIGGDAMALARCTGHVTLVDRDPRKLWMARHNVRVVTGGDSDAVCADVTVLPLRDRVFHLDPARRSDDGRRLHDYGDYQPGPGFIDDLLGRCPTGAIKLGPGVEVESLPLAGSGELQFISERGSLVQAVLWAGALARQRRSATLIDAAGHITTLTGSGEEPVRYAPIGRYLLAIDPAVEHAQLIGRLCETLGVRSIHPKLGLLTSDDPTAGDSPFVTEFEHHATMPVRKVGSWLRQHNAGIVEVKTRGKAANPDQLQHQWRGKGDTPFTIFVLRHDQVVQAHITRRTRS